MTKKRGNLKRGFTLLEMILALVILTLVSTATSGLLFATLKTNTFLQAQGTGVSEIDLAMGRMVYNLRTAGAAPTWSNGTLSIQKTNVGTVSYSVNAGGNLVESDPRYNVGSTPSTLVHGVGSSGFSCTVAAPSGTQTNTLVTVNLTANAGETVERHVTVAVRGF